MSAHEHFLRLAAEQGFQAEAVHCGAFQSGEGYVASLAFSLPQA